MRLQTLAALIFTRTPRHAVTHRVGDDDNDNDDSDDDDSDDDDCDVQAAAPAGGGGGEQVRGQGPAAGGGSCQRQNCRGYHPAGVAHTQIYLEMIFYEPT